MTPHPQPSVYCICGLALFFGESFPLIVIERDDFHLSSQLLADHCGHFGQREGIRPAQFESRAAQTRFGGDIRNGFSKVLGVDQPDLSLRRKRNRIYSFIPDCLPACLKARLDVLHEDRRLDDVKGNAGFDHSFFHVQLAPMVDQSVELRVKHRDVYKMTCTAGPSSRATPLADFRCIFSTARTNLKHGRRALDHPPEVPIVAEVANYSFCDTQSTKTFRRRRIRCQSPDTRALLDEIPYRRGSNLARSTDHHNHVV